MSTRARLSAAERRQASEPSLPTHRAASSALHSEAQEDERTPLLPSSSSASLTPSAGISDLEARWARVKAKVARLAHGKRRAREEAEREREEPRLLCSVFDGAVAREGEEEGAKEGISEEELWEQVALVRAAIAQGLYPKMITTGSSGSYFARARVAVPSASGSGTGSSSAAKTKPETVVTTLAVFKPKDEEPYGNLNPKRAFLRRYFSWAMGRPCLIPNFSAYSEVGASFLDARLGLQLVPRTQLVQLASPSFHYDYKDRTAHEREGRELPEKLGSWQTFLPGYTNASDFLAAHPWPSRPLLERDPLAEARAQRARRRKQGKRLRTCLVLMKHAVLCRQGWQPEEDEEEDVEAQQQQQQATTASAPKAAQPMQQQQPGCIDVAGARDVVASFQWNSENMQSFRLELEKLVCLDYLQRNTDRGLDNFMLRPYVDAATGESRLALGAIDNSLSFPHKHPVGIRSYPMGWLYLPVDLIGHPFAASTRAKLIPLLADPKWWAETVAGLRVIFEKDEMFDVKLFERQMSVMRGQGWNLLQSLRNPAEGPLELCARQKHVVKQEVLRLSDAELSRRTGTLYQLRASDGLPVAVASSLTQPQQRQAAAPSQAVPLDVKPSRASASSGSSTPNGAHPRSLPETRDGVAAAWRSALGGDMQTPTYEGALGIDVVAQADKAARKARRPTLRKTLTGAMTPSFERTFSSSSIIAEERGRDGGAVRRAHQRSLSSAADAPEMQHSLDAAVLEAALEEDPMASSTPALPSTGGARAARRARSRGMSVSGWSITSERVGGAGPLMSEEEGAEDVKVKVVVEHLEADDGIAWQAWLGLGA